MARYVNVSGELTQELIASGSTSNELKISLTNIHADTVCTVDLYLQNKVKAIFYLLKKMELPIGATLVYSDMPISPNGFGLFIKLNKSASETPVVDVIIS